MNQTYLNNNQNINYHLQLRYWLLFLQKLLQYVTHIRQEFTTGLIIIISFQNNFHSKLVLLINYILHTITSFCLFIVAMW